MDITKFANATASRLRRAPAMAVLVAAGVTLVAAGTASAEPKSQPAKKGCEVQLKGPGAGQSVVYPDGYSFSVSASNDGKTHTYTCNDGTWKETIALTAAPGGVAAPIGSVQVLASGAAQYDTRAVAATSFVSFRP